MARRLGELIGGSERASARGAHRLARVAIGAGLWLLAPGCGDRRELVPEPAAEPARPTPGTTSPEAESVDEGPRRPRDEPRDDFERRLFRWSVFHWVATGPGSGLRCVSFRSHHGVGRSGDLIEQDVPEGRPPFSVRWSYEPGRLALYRPAYGEQLPRGGTCEAALDVELGQSGEVTVNGSRWHASREACDESLGRGTAAAFDMGACGAVAVQLRRALDRGPSRNARLSRWLREARPFFWIIEGDDGPECQEVAVSPSEDAPAEEGSFTVDNRVRGQGSVWTWSYVFGDYSHLMLVGPGVEVFRRGEEPQGLYMNCVQPGYVEDHAADALTFDRSPWFPTRRSCLREVRRGERVAMPDC